MSDAPLVPVSRSAARRFLIERLGLATDGAYAPQPPAPAPRVLAAIRRLEAVQLDPVAAVERNQHLVLGARLPGYAPRILEQLLARRAVFEYWANAACVLPIEDYWMFEGVRRRLRARLRRERAALRGPAGRVLRELERAGPLPARAFLSADRIAGYWDNAGPRTKATSHALNVLWDTAEVVVVRREGLERHFDLPERAIPVEQLARAAATDPAAADRALLEKYLRAYRLVDPGDFRFGWRKLPAPRRQAIVARLVAADLVAPLALEGVRRRYYALAEDIDRLRRHERTADAFPPSRIRFLPPLDNLLWRRERLADLFDFAYTWEIYTPAARRRFGYYAMPILAGDRLIGRMDPRLDRAHGQLTVQRLELEPRTALTPALRRALLHALEAFAAFHGAQRLAPAPTAPRALFRA